VGEQKEDEYEYCCGYYGKKDVEDPRTGVLAALGGKKVAAHGLTLVCAQARWSNEAAAEPPVERERLGVDRRAVTPWLPGR
jgi:hypothetical protein